uniref:Dynamin N-terminal domain-containing protein n=1 Tax=Fervidobacterium pennivorans TaxID=93466 RepID=A0A7V4KDT6_FERPE
MNEKVTQKILRKAISKLTSEEKNDILDSQKNKNLELFNENLQLKRQNKDLTQLLKTLEEENTELKTVLQKTEEEFKIVKQNYHSLSEMYEIVKKVLSDNFFENESFKEFEKTYQDFLDFANREYSMKEEAKAIMKLQSIRDKLRNIAVFPSFFRKNIIGVGGSFSAGKSEFINSFLANKKIRLPVGIRPVTAIPTYVVSSQVVLVRGFSVQGGIVEFNHDFLHLLTHDMVKSFGFNLKKILHFLTVEAPVVIGNNHYEHLSFVDTPGYNPGVSGDSTSKDKEISKEFLNQGESIIWLIGLDSTGTIQQSDLEFLDNLEMETKRLFIVLNKADLRPKNDLREIIYRVAEDLELHGIDYEGISAYSSIRKQEYEYEKMSLYDFLEEENNLSLDKQNEIVKEIKSITNMYRKALNNDLSEIEEMHKQLSYVKNEINFNQLSKNSSEKIENLLKKLKAKENELKGYIEELEKLEKRMLRAVDKVFEHPKTI